MQKVKFLKSHHEFAYFAGDIGQLENGKAAQLLVSGHIFLLPDEEANENPLPLKSKARHERGVGKGTIKPR